jgi:hypothetical protein
VKWCGLEAHGLGNIVRRYRLKTPDDFSLLSYTGLLRVRSVGPKTVDSLMDQLRARGITLRGER